MVKISITLLAILTLGGAFAQITRMRHIVHGTQISYYPGQCEEELLEAEGKLTFCDAVGNFGVVDTSLGINAKSIYKMIPNYYNEDLVFTTSGGITIQKESGVWDNIPNRAIDFGYDGGTTPTVAIQDAVILPNGTMPLLGFYTGNILNVYDFESKTINAISLENVDHFPWAICYDPDKEVAWVLAQNSVSTGSNYLYKLEGEILTYEMEIENGHNVGILHNDSWQYSNNRIYMATSIGLTVIEIEEGSNFTELIYDSSNTEILPYDACSDMVIDNAGVIWLLQGNTGAPSYAVVRFDPESMSYNLYSQQQPDDPDTELSFNTIGLDRNTEMFWIESSFYDGLYSLEFNDETAIWNQYPVEDFDALGVPYLNHVNFIHTQGSRTFFCTSSYDTPEIEENEILILENEEWSGINNDDQGYISHKMLRRFHGSYSDDNGGVWWINDFDEDLVYWSDMDNFSHFTTFELNNADVACIEQSQNLVLRIGDAFGVFDVPSFVPYEETSFYGQPNDVAAWSNEVWSIRTSDTPQHLVRYIDGSIIQEYEFDEISYYSEFTVTTDKRMVFAAEASGAVNVKIFDPVTEEIDDLVYLGEVGPMVEVIPVEDGKFWIIGEWALLYYNGLDFEYYDDENLNLANIFFNNIINSAVLDQEQNLHFLLSGGYIYTLAQPYDNLDLANNIKIKDIDGVLPYYNYNASGFKNLALDSDGDLWLSETGSLIEIEGLAAGGEFDVTDIIGIDELPSNKLNFNIYPNPNADRNLNVMLPEEIFEANLNLYDLTGKLMQSFEIRKQKSTIILDHLSNGIYNLQLITESGVSSQKVVLE